MSPAGHDISARWGVLSGRLWMVQYALDGTISLGIHIDPFRRRSAHGSYGPYIDLHLLFFAVSIGFRPGRAWNHSLMRPGLIHANSD